MTATTFGLPNEWRDFERRHARLLQSVLPRLMEAATRVFVRTIEAGDPHERLAFMLGRHVPEDFKAVCGPRCASNGMLGRIRSILRLDPPISKVAVTVPLHDGLRARELDVRTEAFRHRKVRAAGQQEP
jgi:hypothetical protein